MSGAFNPHPLQFGQQSQKIIEQLQTGLADAQGTALATEQGTVAWVENHATARVVAELANAAQKLANQWDPLKTTDFLERWERILGIVPSPTESDNERRMNLLLKLSLSGEAPTYQVVYDFIKDLLGNLFVTIINTSSNDANSSIPGGLVIPGGAILGNDDWRSSISYMAIETFKPDNVEYYQFYNIVNKIFIYLPYFLPAWCTFDWFLDGPNGIGFYLDQDYNLDNQRFD
jgi:hypothetical protein